MLRTLSVALGLLAALSLTGWKSLQRTDSLFGFITPYRIDVVQGNAITKEQAAQIKPGLSRLQAKDILGTPLISDPFHAQRWDYFFSLRRPGAPLQRRSVVVFFDGDVVKSIEAGELPSEREFVASISRFKSIREQKLELSDDERKALPLPPKPVVAPVEPVGPVRTYPPLENT